MPRLYLSPADFLSYPAALTFQFQVAQLTSIFGAMDKLMARASRRVDLYARKRIVSPPATTIGTGGIAMGGALLPLTSTLGIDNGQEEAVIIGSGGTQEIVPIVPGGIQVTNWASPYPGVIQLANPVQYSHVAGEAVQGCYQEVSTVGSSDSSDYYSEMYLQFSQDAQIAAAHAPYAGTQNLTRMIFLKCYPIRQLFKIEHMLPISSEYNTLDASKVGIQPASGYLRLPLGSFVLPEGLIRTTYIAGFANVPDEIQEATSLYVADELQMMKSQGTYEMQSGKVKARYLDAKATKSRYESQAEEIIDRGYRRRT